MNTRFEYAKSILILAVIGVLASCAEVQPKKSEAEAAQEPPHSKPVKMPPTNRKLGSSESIAFDEFFAAQQSENVLVYDVRVPYFYGIDHIPGAINWPYTQYEDQVQQRDIEIQKALKKGKLVVLYCFNLGCPEARNVAKKLSRRDYDVRVFNSGIDSWREAGLPLEKVKAGP